MLILFWNLLAILKPIHLKQLQRKKSGYHIADGYKAKLHIKTFSVHASSLACGYSLDFQRSSLPTRQGNCYKVRTRWITETLVFVTYQMPVPAWYSPIRFLRSTLAKADQIVLRSPIVSQGTTEEVSRIFVLLISPSWPGLLLTHRMQWMLCWPFCIVTQDRIGLLVS